MIWRHFLKDQKNDVFFNSPAESMPLFQFFFKDFDIARIRDLESNFFKPFLSSFNLVTPINQPKSI